MKTIILSTALLLLSFLSFGHTITYSISYSVGDSLTVYTNDNAKDFKETLLYVRTMLHDDFENARILEADFNRVEAYIQNEIESLVLGDLEPIKTKVTNPVKANPIKTTKQPLNVPQQQTVNNEVKEVIYIVSYGLGDEVMSYESFNIIDYAIDLQDAIDFLNEDLFNERISLEDFERINAYFNAELDKIFLNSNKITLL
jgi:hypothetical protein